MQLGKRSYDTNKTDRRTDGRTSFALGLGHVNIEPKRLILPELLNIYKDKFLLFQLYIIQQVMILSF